MLLLIQSQLATPGASSPQSTALMLGERGRAGVHQSRGAYPIFTCLWGLLPQEGRLGDVSPHAAEQVSLYIPPAGSFHDYQTCFLISVSMACKAFVYNHRVPESQTV